MSLIGQFTRTKSGYSGRVRTLGLDAEVVLVPAEQSDADGPEVGAAWKRTGEKAGDYVSLQIDDPTFGHPLRANLFRSSDDNAAWGLHWNRPPKRGERD